MVFENGEEDIRVGVRIPGSGNLILRLETGFTGSETPYAHE